MLQRFSAQARRDPRRDVYIAWWKGAYLRNAKLHKNRQLLNAGAGPRSVKEEAHPLNAVDARPAAPAPPPQGPARAVFGKIQATTPDL